MRAFATAPAGFALPHTIVLAMLTDLAMRSRPLIRTPERAQGQPLMRAVRTVRKHGLFCETGTLADATRSEFVPHTALDDAR